MGVPGGTFRERLVEVRGAGPLDLLRLLSRNDFGGISGGHCKSSLVLMFHGPGLNVWAALVFGRLI